MFIMSRRVCPHPSRALQATRKFKAEAHTGNHPNDPAAELFESGGSSSSGTWMASDACDAFSNGSNDSGSNGSSECVDCDPGSLRLRSLLQAAARERSASLTSSCCDGESESEGKESEEREREEEVGGGAGGRKGRRGSSLERPQRGSSWSDGREIPPGIRRQRRY